MSAEIDQNLAFRTFPMRPVRHFHVCSSFGAVSPKVRHDTGCVTYRSSDIYDTHVTHMPRPQWSYSLPKRVLINYYIWECAILKKRCTNLTYLPETFNKQVILNSLWPKSSFGSVLTRKTEYRIILLRRNWLKRLHNVQNVENSESSTVIFVDLA